MTLCRYCFVILLLVGLAGCASDTDQNQAPAATSDQVQNADRETGSSPADSVEDAETVIVFLGDSITAGWGLDRTEAFPYKVQEALREEGFSVVVRDAGVSGETTAGGLRRIDWILNQKVDILVIELGGNDGLRGLPIEQTEDNIRQMVRKTRETDPDIQVVVAGMQLPPNMGTEYTTAFGSIFSRVAKDEGTDLIPFILQGVGGIAEMNQADGIHPTAEGHSVIAETVLEVIEPIVRQLQ